MWKDTIFSLVIHSTITASILTSTEMADHMGHDGMMGDMTTQHMPHHSMGHTMEGTHPPGHGGTHPPGHGSTHPPGHGDGTEHMMQMYFYLSTQVTILFQEWEVTTTGGFVGACIGVFLAAMLYEGLKVWREILLRESAVNVRSHTMPITNKGSQTMLTETHEAGHTRFLSWAHALQTILHIIQVTMSYFLMLIFMTYNGYLCIAVVLGAGAGYFVFGWKKAIVVDINEHCH